MKSWMHGVTEAPEQVGLGCAPDTCVASFVHVSPQDFSVDRDDTMAPAAGWRYLGWAVCEHAL